MEILTPIFVLVIMAYGFAIMFGGSKGVRKLNRWIARQFKTFISWILGIAWDILLGILTFAFHMIRNAVAWSFRKIRRKIRDHIRERRELQRAQEEHS